MIAKQFLTLGLMIALLFAPNSLVWASAAEMALLPQEPMVIDDQPPSVAAAFEVRLSFAGGSFQLRGFFPGYQSDMYDIQTYYSLDQQQYQAVDGEIFWNYPAELPEGDILQNTIVNAQQSPLKDYLAGDIDTFYLRLHYKTAQGDGVSQVAQFTRPTEAMPLPEDMAVVVRYPSTMKIAGWPPQYAYHVTVRAGATGTEIMSLLPETLPLEVQLVKGTDLQARAEVDCGVKWAAAGENAIKMLTPPRDLMLATLDGLGLYRIEELPTPPMPLALKIHSVDRQDSGFFALHRVADDPQSALYLDFPLKPTGAQVIVPSYSLDNGATWIETDELLAHNDAVEAHPKNADYRYATLFTPQQTPYKAYLAGELEGFLVRLDIRGGTFEGRSAAVPWPMDYHYEPPPKDGDASGSGGNENNAGSGNGSGGNAGSSGNGGQRPTLPEDQALVVAPLEKTHRPQRNETLSLGNTQPEERLSLLLKRDGVEKMESVKRALPQNVQQDNRSMPGSDEAWRERDTDMVQTEGNIAPRSGREQVASQQEASVATVVTSSTEATEATEATAPSVSTAPTESTAPTAPRLPAAAGIVLTGGVALVAVSVASATGVAAKLLVAIKRFFSRP